LHEKGRGKKEKSSLQGSNLLEVWAVLSFRRKGGKGGGGALYCMCQRLERKGEEKKGKRDFSLLGAMFMGRGKRGRMAIYRLEKKCPILIGNPDRGRKFLFLKGATVGERKRRGAIAPEKERERKKGSRFCRAY